MSALEQDREFTAPRQVPADRLEPAFERFYREHYAFVWRSARRMLPGAGDGQIEDLIQDTWLTVYRRFDSFEGQCRPTTWLFGILRNVARNRARGERRRDARLSAFAIHERAREQIDAGTDATGLLARGLLDRFLATLDDDKRAVFVLAELEGQTGREIAEALAINPNTAQSRLRAARRQFCAHFELPEAREQITARTLPHREHPEQPTGQARAHSRALLLAGLAPSSLVTGASGGLGAVMALGHGVVIKLVAGVGAVIAVGVAVVVGSDIGAREVSSIDAKAEPRGDGSRATRDQDPVATGTAATSDDPSDDSSLTELAPILVTAEPGPPAPKRLRATEPEPGVQAHDRLRSARAALVADQPDRALALVRSIPATDGGLRAERVATEIAALCRLDRADEAQRSAERFAIAEPESPWLARIDHACW